MDNWPLHNSHQEIHNSETTWAAPELPKITVTYLLSPSIAQLVVHRPVMWTRVWILAEAWVASQLLLFWWKLDNAGVIMIKKIVTFWLGWDLNSPLMGWEEWLLMLVSLSKKWQLGLQRYPVYGFITLSLWAYILFPLKHNMTTWSFHKELNNCDASVWSSSRITIIYHLVRKTADTV